MTFEVERWKQVLLYQNGLRRRRWRGGRREEVVDLPGIKLYSLYVQLPRDHDHLVVKNQFPGAPYGYTVPVIPSIHNAYGVLIVPLGILLYVTTSRETCAAQTL